MWEAFNYAQQHDQREETPQYSAMPVALGEQWTLTKKQGDGIGERRMDPRLQPGRKCYDLLGRRLPSPAAADGRHTKSLNARQSSRHSPILITKP